LLFLDNFQATADTPPAKVDTAAAPAVHHPVATTLPEGLATTEVPATEVTLPAATVFDPAPTTSTTAAPTTTTTAKRPVATTATTAAPTTTTAKPRPIAAIAAPTTTTTHAPAPSTTLPPARSLPTTSPDPDAGATWDALAKCEANGNWAANTGNGYYGGLQFSLATWHDLGGDGYPHQASRARQIEIGRKLFDRSGWNAWPGCARKLGWS
jgi:hypothetical protein